MNRSGYLLDTHILLWSMESIRGGMSVEAQRIVAGVGNDLYVSIATLWELAIKRSVGKLELPDGGLRAVLAFAYRSGLRVLPLEEQHILAYETLPMHHRDPYDRVVIAQAKVEGLTLISVDREFAQYGVPVLS